MSKTLVIAEKPSVAQDIVRALTPVAGQFAKHDDYFHITTPDSDWKNCLAHAEKIGMGTREYELIK